MTGANDHEATSTSGVRRRTVLTAGVLGGAAALTSVGAAAPTHAAPTHAAGTASGGESEVWVRPGDPRYEQAVAGFNTTLSRRPEAVVLARHPRHVQHAVRYAAHHDLPVAVLATGHQASVSFDGGILVSTAAMNDVHLDGRSASARVGPGTRWAAVAQASAPARLAPLSGSASSVGVVGYTLGGGLSPALGRLHGYAADHVSRLEIVTPDGELRVATPECETDLFWAARGGKGNFGIVTSLEFGLFGVRTLYAGAVMYPAESAPEVLPAWRDWAASAPESVTTSAAFINIPPNAPVPDPIRGRLIVSVRVSFLGSADEGAALVAPLRAAAPVLLDTVEAIPITDLDRVHMDPVGPIPAWERTSLLRELPDEAIARMIDLGGSGSASPLALVEVRQLGGALAREPEVANAVGHRDAAYTFFAVGIAPPGQDDEVRSYAAGFVGAMERWSTGGTYVNFLSSDEAHPDDVRRAYAPDVYRRLVSIKSHIDPGNMFRLTHNIPPGS